MDTLPSAHGIRPRSRRQWSAGRGLFGARRSHPKAVRRPGTQAQRPGARRRRSTGSGRLSPLVRARHPWPGDRGLGVGDDARDRRRRRRGDDPAPRWRRCLDLVLLEPDSRSQRGLGPRYRGADRHRSGLVLTRRRGGPGREWSGGRPLRAVGHWPGHAVPGRRGRARADRRRAEQSAPHPEHTVAVMETMDRVREAIGLRYPGE